MKDDCCGDVRKCWHVLKNGGCVKLSEGERDSFRMDGFNAWSFSLLCETMEEIRD